MKYQAYLDLIANMVCKFVQTSKYRCPAKQDKHKWIQSTKFISDETRGSR